MKAKQILVAYQGPFRSTVFFLLKQVFNILILLQLWGSSFFCFACRSYCSISLQKAMSRATDATYSPLPCWNPLPAFWLNHFIKCFKCYQWKCCSLVVQFGWTYWPSHHTFSSASTWNMRFWVLYFKREPLYFLILKSKSSKKCCLLFILLDKVPLGNCFLQDYANMCCLYSTLRVFNNICSFFQQSYSLPTLHSAELKHGFRTFTDPFVLQSLFKT